MYARILLIAAFIVLAASSSVFAQDAASPETLEQLIVQLYDGSVRIVGLAAFLMILFAGMVRMGIIPGRAPEESTSIILDAVVGLILLLSAVVILQSINPDTIRQNTSPVFDESRYEFPESRLPDGGGSSSGTNSTTNGQGAPSGQGPTIITPSGESQSVPPATFIRGNIYPIIVQ